MTRSEDEILAGTDLARVHRFTLLVAIAWALFALSHAIAGRMLMALLHAAAFVVSAIAAALTFSSFSWRDRVSLPLVAGGSLVALVAIAVLTGGSDAPAMGFVSLVPLVTGLFRERRRRVVWLLVSLAFIGSIPLLAAWAPASVMEPVSVAHRVVAALGLAVLLYLWGSEWRGSSDAQAALLAERARTIEAQSLAIAHASELKSRFVAMTSHELRGPLNGILGMSHALADTRLSDPQRELVRSLSSSAESLSTLLADLLDLARIEAGRLDVVLAPTEVREVIADVVDAFAPEAAKKGLELIALADPSVPLVMDADAGRLAQVLRNLVSNAVKFTSEGTIVLEARRAEGLLELRVVDTGRGMRPEDVGRIFAPFEQVSADLVDRRAGTGLGLWIARNIVERWGGEIDVTSAPDAGTTFRVTMPIAGEIASAARTSVPAVDAIALQTRRPALVRAFASVATELGIVIDDSSRTMVVDLESLEPTEIEALDARRGSGLVLAAGAARLAECEQIAARCGARVLLLPVRAARLRHALDGTRELLRGTLLVVDDDAINRRVVRHAAERLGLDVHEADGEEDALRIARSSRIDVALLDLHLAHTSGDAIARQLQRALGADAPVLVAYTGTVNERDRRRLHDAGMVDVLTKPLDRSAFSAAIERALHAKRRARRATLPPPPAFALEPAAMDELGKIMGDRDAALELLRESIPEMQSRVGTIRDAIAKDDLSRVASESHKLASMAATFGATQLAEVARGLESASRGGSGAELRALGVALRETQSETAPLLRALLPQ